MRERPSKDAYFLAIAEAVAARSTYLMCAKAVINADILRVVYRPSDRYDGAGVCLLDRAGLTLWELEGGTQ